jgi:DNA-binding response OmpR family regulator
MGTIIVARSIMPLLEGHQGILSRKEFTVLPAASAEEILTLHETADADLVIVDFGVPAIGGEAICFLLRKKEGIKRVSIIAIADGDGNAAERLMACGANAVFSRPVNPDHLYEKITELLNIGERKDMREVVKVSVSIASEGESFFAVSQNISISGLLFETSRSLPKGLSVTCSFVLQHQLTVQGEIVRAAKRSENNGGTYEYGVRFTRIDPVTESEIVKHVIRHEPGRG